MITKDNIELIIGLYVEKRFTKENSDKSFIEIIDIIYKEINE